MRKILITMMTVVLMMTMAGCQNNVNDKETTEQQSETTTVDILNNKISGEIACSGFDGENDYWVIETESGEEIGFFSDKKTKITWTDEVEETFKGEYKEDIIYYAEALEIEVRNKKELTEEEMKDLDEEVTNWYVADKIKVIRAEEYDDTLCYKPVIYLYPQKETNVNVKLDYNGELTITYPEYKEDGWDVTAQPDGTLTDLETGKEYSYLFWEGVDNIDYDMSEGFVVEGEDTAEFLQEKLSYMGLTPREYNEFIVFWLPKMKDNKYNLIKFQGTQYTDNAKLTVSPKPDSELRIFMTWKALDEKIEIPTQILSTFQRKGFAVVEWGGMELH